MLERREVNFGHCVFAIKRLSDKGRRREGSELLAKSELERERKT